MAIAKLREGDTVVLLSGKDKGQVGVILKIRENVSKTTGQVKRQIKVQGIHLVSKCIARNPQKDEKGGIRKQEAFFDASNVALWNSEKQSKIRVMIKKDAAGKRVRFDRDSNEPILNTGGSA